MSKIFAVPYNGSSSLIDTIIDLGLDKHVFEMYGVDDFFSHGRIMTEKPVGFKDDIKKLIDHNIEFDYLFNSLSYEDYYANTDKLLERLKFLQDVGISTLSISHPMLVDTIKEAGFKFFINSSVNSFLNSIEKVDLMLKRGYDRIIIDENNIRNIKFVQQVCNFTNKPVELMINNGCITDCIDRLSHIAMYGSYQDKFKKTDMYNVEWKVRGACRKNFRKNPSYIVKASWIRPEDIKRYLNIGVSLFKLSGRTFPDKSIIQALQIYSSGKYEGNVFDYIYPFLNLKERYGFQYLENSKVNDYFEHIYNDCNREIDCQSCKVLLDEINNHIK